MPLWQELGHALRGLRKNPGFTLVAVLTLALGIGANTAIFSIVNGVILSPLRYPDADRIVAVSTYWKQTGETTARLAGGDLLDIRDGGQVFDSLSYYIGGEMGVQLTSRAEFAGAYFVNPEFFRVFGVQPVYGRLFELGQSSQSVVPSAAVSLAFAERNFGSGPIALGRTLRIENKIYAIAAVLPAGFQFPRQAEVWVPAPLTPQNLSRTAYNYPVIAKLKPGVTLSAAQARLETRGARLAMAFPDSNRYKSFVAIPLRDQLAGPVRATLYLLMGAVALVLLIACTNVADLMLARATARSSEIAVRAALGARRWHIVRPLLLESLVLALGGGALGLLFARFGMDVLVRMSANRVPLPRLNEIHVDGMVLAFASGISLLACLLFGLTPAWQAARVDLHDALKQRASRGQLCGRSALLRNAPVVAQIALSFVLAIGAGLLLRSFVALSTVHLGYRTSGILVMYAHAPARSLDQYVGVGRLFERILTELRGIPGVTSVAAVMGLPAGQYSVNGNYAVEGNQVFAPGQPHPHAGFRLASPGYFDAMGIPLPRGRDFSPRDQFGTPLVAIVSEALARQSFPNEDPLGHRLQCDFDSTTQWVTIVGVAADVRQDSPASAPAPQLYMPLPQHPYSANEIQVVVRTSLDPGSVAGAVRQKVHRLNPEIAMKFTTMDEMVADSIARPRFRTLLIGTFAGLALLLAMAGVYGVMSYTIAQRTPEFGLRVALGAGAGDIVGLVLMRAARLAGIGLTIGLALSLAVSRFVSTMLFGVKPTDATTYAAVLLAVIPVILLAAAVPAWRAARIDPLTALAEE
jgi:putative ABC transport system permease protein